MPFESNGYFCITRDYLRTNRIVAEADPLVRGQRFQPHRAARVQFLRADRHLCAEAELAAVGEAGGAFTYTAENPLRSRSDRHCAGARQDGVRMLRAMSRMRNGVVEIGNDFHVQIQ
jgi:hypothetical protein